MRTLRTPLRVAAHSDAKGVAGSLVRAIHNGENVELVAIGAGAVNQAVKATAIARGICAQHAMCVAIITGFKDVEVGGEIVSAIVLVPILLHERDSCSGIATEETSGPKQDVV